MPAAASDSSLQFERYMTHLPPGLTRVPDRPEVYSGEDRRRRSWYAIGTYQSLQGFKRPVFTADQNLGLGLGARGEWDRHHIVEGQHFAEISFQGLDFPRMYQRVLPCVLLDSFEHEQHYNEVLHSDETLELLEIAPLAKGEAKETRAVAAYEAFQAARRRRDAAALTALRRRVERMRELYSDLYLPSPVLRQIARNVFDVTLDLFNR